MRIVIQKVREAAVSVGGELVSSIGEGLVVLLGVEEGDSSSQAEWLAQKVANMRIFSDEQGKMNWSVLDVDGSVLLVSQFTLYGDASKGNRPSFIKAARPEEAEPLYEHFASHLEKLSVPTKLGVFGANMNLMLNNDGPVTILLDK